jgi:hypothetical protein
MQTELPAHGPQSRLPPHPFAPLPHSHAWLAQVAGEHVHLCVLALQVVLPEQVPQFCVEPQPSDTLPHSAPCDPHVVLVQHVPFEHMAGAVHPQVNEPEHPSLSVPH